VLLEKAVELLKNGAPGAWIKPFHVSLRREAFLIKGCAIPFCDMRHNWPGLQALHDLGGQQACLPLAFTLVSR
jgi:hypothetical protein